MEFYGIEERKTGIRWIQSHQLQYISAEQPYAEANVGIYTGRTNDGYGLGLYWTDFSATAPEVKTFTVDIPGRNGLLDYSEALTGSPVYKNATLSATFVAACTMAEWHKLYQNVRQELHGQVCTIVADSNSSYAYRGRCTVDSTMEDAKHAVFTISADIEPYCYDNFPLQKGFLWDATDFSGSLPDALTLSESGEITETLYAPNGRVGGLYGEVTVIAEFPCTVTINGTAKEIEEADVILLNTCAIRENAEEKVFGKVGYVKNLKKKNPNLIFGLCGCMAQEEVVIKRILEKHPHIDLIFGTHNIHRLPTLLKEAMFSKEMVVEVWSKEGDVIENTPVTRANGHKAWVNIMYGCNKFCTYCIVPYTRGKERSRLMDDIIEEVKGLKADGYQEITLLGQNVNSYGKDLEEDYDFATLLEEVAKTGIARIRFTTSHPWDFSREMIEIINQYDNIMPYIHLPVQSGNTEILKLMGRRYTREQYLELFRMIKEVMPDCSITTDIIVGFPNETEEQFQDTLSLYEECEYDLAYTFIYSPREGTPAAKMQDNVPFEQKQDRLERLNEVVKEKALKQNQRFLNQIVDVLVDGPSKRDETMMTGYTAHQKLINFKGRKEDIGKIVPVKVTEVKTWALKGEQVD